MRRAWTAIVLPYNPICFDRSLRHWNGANCLRMFGEKRQN
jgi:hypothetical protein